MRHFRVSKALVAMLGEALVGLILTSLAWSILLIRKERSNQSGGI